MTTVPQPRNPEAVITTLTAVHKTITDNASMQLLQLAIDEIEHTSNTVQTHDPVSESDVAETAAYLRRCTVDEDTALITETHDFGEKPFAFAQSLVELESKLETGDLPSYRTWTTRFIDADNGDIIDTKEYEYADGFNLNDIESDDNYTEIDRTQYGLTETTVYVTTGINTSQTL